MCFLVGHKLNRCPEQRRHDPDQRHCSSRARHELAEGRANGSARLPVWIRFNCERAEHEGREQNGHDCHGDVYMLGSGRRPHRRDATGSMRLVALTRERCCEVTSCRITSDAHQPRMPAFTVSCRDLSRAARIPCCTASDICTSCHEKRVYGEQRKSSSEVVYVLRHERQKQSRRGGISAVPHCGIMREISDKPPEGKPAGQGPHLRISI